MIQCRLCNSKKCKISFTANNYHGRHFWSKEEFPVYYCKKCGCYFLSKVEIKKNYYKKYYPKEYLVGPSWLDKFFGLFKKGLIEKNIDIGKKIKILDIGCGNGGFLKNLSDSKFDKYGVEIKKNKFIPKNVRIIEGDIDKINFGKQKFDIITLWHVLEHLPDPKKTLIKINKILNKNGKLFLAVPNSNCLGFKIGKKYFFHLDSPRHLFLPNKRNLRGILHSTGYKNIIITNLFMDYPLDLWWSVRKSPLKYIIYPLYPIFKFFSPETILIQSSK